MAKDNAESKEIPETAEKTQQEPPLTQAGTRSMQGPPEWTEKEDKLLADVQRMKEEQEEERRKLRSKYLREKLSRRQEELKAIVNDESAGENEPQVE